MGDITDGVALFATALSLVGLSGEFPSWQLPTTMEVAFCIEGGANACPFWRTHLIGWPTLEVYFLGLHARAEEDENRSGC